MLPFCSSLDPAKYSLYPPNPAWIQSEIFIENRWELVLRFWWHTILEKVWETCSYIIYRFNASSSLSCSEATQQFPLLYVFCWSVRRYMCSYYFRENAISSAVIKIDSYKYIERKKTFLWLKTMIEKSMHFKMWVFLFSTHSCRDYK